MKNGAPGTIQVFDNCGPLSPGVRVIYCCAANCPKPQETYYLTFSESGIWGCLSASPTRSQARCRPGTRALKGAWGGGIHFQGHAGNWQKASGPCPGTPLGAAECPQRGGGFLPRGLGETGAAAGSSLREARRPRTTTSTYSAAAQVRRARVGGLLGS